MSILWNLTMQLGVIALEQLCKPLECWSWLTERITIQFMHGTPRFHFMMLTCSFKEGRNSLKERQEAALTPKDIVKLPLKFSVTLGLLPKGLGNLHYIPDRLTWDLVF